MEKTQTRPWDPAEHLETEEDMVAYLNVALEEGDLRLIMATLGDIARARKMAVVAQETGLGRESLYKSLSADGCADNALARKAMAECLPGHPARWLIDAGNDTNWGQVLVGNVAGRVDWDEPAFEGETCYLAPAPTLQRPDLLTAVSTRPPDVVPFLSDIVFSSPCSPIEFTCADHSA